MRARWVLAAAGLVVAVPVAAQLTDVIPDWGNPFQQQIVERDSTPLLLALRDLAEYHAATGSFQVVIDVEHDTPHVPAVISGERATFLGVGSVDATVDFAGLSAERVTVSPDRRSVTIALPAPQLAAAVVDPTASRVIGRERGLIDRVSGVFQDSPTSEHELYQRAQAAMNDAARTSDLTQRAAVGTRAMLAALGRSLGFSEVSVTFADGGPGHD